MFNSANMLRTGEDWESWTCHLASHRINIFYPLNGSLKLIRIVTHFQTREHEKLITTFFTGYFPSPSACHKNLRFCWKLLRTIIYPLEMEKLIITFFRKKCEFVTTDIYRKIYRYTLIYTTPIYLSNAIYWYIDISVPSLPKIQKYNIDIWTQ